MTSKFSNKKLKFKFNITNLQRLVHQQTSTNEKCDKFSSCILEPLLIVIGIIFNLIFGAIVIRNRNKPTSRFLLLMVACDLVSLTSLFTAFLSTLKNVPDFSSRIRMCQLSYFFSNYFAVLNLFTILAISFILITIIRLKYSENLISRRKYQSNSFRREAIRRHGQFTENISNSKKVRDSCTLIQIIQNSQYDIKSLNYQENFYMIFVSFLCLYFLSFILWTSGDTQDEAKYFNTILMCKTYDFAKKFMNVYQAIFKKLRLLIILFSFTVSCIFNVVCRNDLFNIFCLKSRKTKHSSNDTQKQVNFSSIDLIFSKSQFQKWNSKNKRNKPNKFMDKNQLDFIQFWAIFLTFYSIFYFPKCFKEVYEIVKEYTGSDEYSMKEYNQDIDYQKYDLILNLTEKFAFSCKLMIFLLFFYHVNVQILLKKKSSLGMTV